MTLIKDTLRPYVPRIEDYFGLWALQPEVGQAIEQLVNGKNLLAHVQANIKNGAKNGTANQLVEVQDGIATIHIEGVLQKRESSLYASTSTTSVRIAAKQLAKDDSVRGVVLRIESPGGSAAGVQEAAEAIEKLAAVKPVHAFIEDLGASGAYWLASAATSITANASALIGSIGVFSLVEDSSKQAETLGIKVHVIKAGEMKAGGAWGVEVSEDYLEHLREDIVGPTYAAFTTAVARGRKAELASVVEYANGKVWHAAKAREFGLIDAVATFEDFSESFLKELDTMTNANDSAAKPQAATLSQLKAWFPDASSDFILRQLEAGSTELDATRAYVDLQRARAEAAEAAKASAEEALTKAKNQPKLDTVDDLTERSDSESKTTHSAGEFRKRFQSAIAAKMAAGMRRSVAYNAVCAESPELLEAVIGEANQKN